MKNVIFITIAVLTLISVASAQTPPPDSANVQWGHVRYMRNHLESQDSTMAAQIKVLQTQSGKASIYTGPTPRLNRLERQMKNLQAAGGNEYLNLIADMYVSDMILNTDKASDAETARMAAAYARNTGNVTYVIKTHTEARKVYTTNLETTNANFTALASAIDDSATTSSTPTSTGVTNIIRIQIDQR